MKKRRRPTTPKLPPNQALAASDKWPVVGESAPLRDGAPWRVEVAGLVERPRAYTLDELRALPWSERRVDVHCVTRWSKLGMRFGGVELHHVLDDAGPLPEAHFVSFVAKSEHGHSTSLPLATALELATLITFTRDGKPLEEIHGGPVRTVVPKRYFYKSLKWLARIELLAEDRLGTWEAESGYHNHADPWLEERYIAGNLDRLEVKSLLDERNMSGRELLSIQAAGMDLAGLEACGAVLRNASFDRARLAGARFDGACLANARFRGADLTGASFRDADIEGADFRGADLAGADLVGASFFGTTFCPEPGQREEKWGPARLLGSRFEDGQLERLTPVQQAFLRGEE